MATPLTLWLDLIDREYLADFIPAGGGALRFVVAEPDVLEQAATELRAAAVRRGLSSLAIDSGALKLQQVQHLFFAIAQAVNWDALMQHPASKCCWPSVAIPGPRRANEWGWRHWPKRSAWCRICCAARWRRR